MNALPRRWTYSEQTPSCSVRSRGSSTCICDYCTRDAVYRCRSFFVPFVGKGYTKTCTNATAI